MVCLPNDPESGLKGAEALENSAGSGGGGAVRADTSLVVFSDNRFEANWAEDRGGALGLGDRIEASFARDVFVNNRAANAKLAYGNDGGGAVFIEGGQTASNVDFVAVR
eukprot:1185446-Prorocentrum_minimum.AAC.1